MRNQPFPDEMLAVRSKIHYGWVIVAASTLMIAITYGVLYSYSVFFKPLAEHFSWDRATVSLIYSAALMIRGAISIGVGWLADRYSPSKIMVFCGCMIIVGLALSSQVTSLWQLFLTYAVVESVGLSGAYGIGTTITSRWFLKNRGLALGIVSTGSGLGTVFIVPGIERLISTYDWAQAFILIGTIAGIATVLLALLLRPAPASTPPENGKIDTINKAANNMPSSPIDMPVGKAMKDTRMILLMSSFLLFFFGIQIVMVHLVNYATDIGITPLVAASFISVIGAVSIIGRLATGTGSDRIGIYNTLMLTRVFLTLSFICLIFTRSLPAFYLFTILFSLPYGGEVPQVPLFIGKYFGTKSMATLVGVNLFVISVGGAIGSWMAGEIFDNTQSYQWAFIAGALAGIGSLLLVLVMRKQNVAKDAV